MAARRCTWRRGMRAFVGLHREGARGSRADTSRAPVGAPEREARARAPSSRIAAGFCSLARPSRAPAGGHVVPRGGTYTLHAARRPPGRSGASTCRAGDPPRGGKRSHGPAPVRLHPPRPGSRTPFPAAPARTSEEVERCLGAAVLADAWSLPVSCFLGHPSGWGPGPGLRALRASAGSLGGDRGEPPATHRSDVPVRAWSAGEACGGHPPVLFVHLGGCEAAGVAGCGGGHPSPRRGGPRTRPRRPASSRGEGAEALRVVSLGCGNPPGALPGWVPAPTEGGCACLGRVSLAGTFGVSFEPLPTFGARKL